MVSSGSHSNTARPRLTELRSFAPLPNEGKFSGNGLPKLFPMYGYLVQPNPAIRIRIRNSGDRMAYSILMSSGYSNADHESEVLLPLFSILNDVPMFKPMDWWAVHCWCMETSRVCWSVRLRPRSSPILGEMYL